MKKAYNINQLRDYSCLFSRSEVNRWIDNDFDSVNLKIRRYDDKIAKTTYLKYLKSVYKVLQKFYANEYVYKNEFLNQWLIKELGSEKSIIFNEFRLGKAVADLVMFNGCSRVFEIKTLLDKESRLNSQLEEYKKIFNEIYLIIPNSKIETYKNYHESIGLIAYNQEKKEFLLVRKAIKNHSIDTDSIMKILHTKEYRNIVKEYYGEIPICNDFEQFNVCKKLIEEIPQEELSKLFIETMKQRKIFNRFSSNYKEFNQICLSLNLTDKQKEKLFINLNSTIVY
ncbi:sce7726 family protein [Flavobacterium sp.]|uniref:sce7726 family protein n=1 Tax=Flavobacterium sp. TaxID=239 RepID=UPI00391B5D4E